MSRGGTGIFTRPGRSPASHTRHRWRKAGRVYLPEAHSYRYTHACRIAGCPAKRDAMVMIPEPKLTRRVETGGPPYTERWMCVPPPSSRWPWPVYEITSHDWGTDAQTGELTELIYAWKELLI